MKRIIIIILALFTMNSAFAQQSLVGIVRDVNGLPLHGANIRVKGTALATATNSDGRFELNLKPGRIILNVTSLGFKPKAVSIQVPLNDLLQITLEASSTELQLVEISTGYQKISPERTTGSFVHLDSTLLNRKVSTGILQRLEDITPGLIFNRAATAGDGINSMSIRGQSTIYSNTQPLIVLDNFPYEGDLNSINPNDIQSITVLKDAAAASIWGARAANGVIVITSKQGAYNRSAKITFNSSLNIGARPDLNYQSRLSTADFIEIEKTLFANDFYSSAELSTDHPSLTPVVELLISKRDGTLSATEADSRIEALKSQDVRRDYAKYFYRPSLNRQYSFTMNGGGEKQRYAISAGYDRNEANLVNNSDQRFTVNASNSYSFLNNKLELSTNIFYSSLSNRNNNAGFGALKMSPDENLYPYARFADEQGNALTIIKDYRRSFTEDAENDGLLNWQYMPLDELARADNLHRNNEYRLNFGSSYRLWPQLKADILYQYTHGLVNQRNNFSADSWYSRNLVNQYTAKDMNNQVIRPVPLGDIVDRQEQANSSHHFRTQLNYSQLFNDKHEVNAIAGFEINDLNTVGNNYRLYGYDPEHASATVVSYNTNFPQYTNPGALKTIPNMDESKQLTDRYRSYYSNGSYTYNQLYTVSLSGRVDQSNIFGVKANQRSVPLWSAGAAWNLSSEPFYHLKTIPYLKLRASYGFNGNVNKQLSAYTTAYYSNGNGSQTALPFAQVSNPPNNELRWERVKVINAGLDFQTFGKVLSGSLDIYKKTGLDLIGDIPYAPSTGITTFRGNNASTKGQGLDLVLNSRNIDAGFKWYSNFIFSRNTSKVIDYKYEANSAYYLQFAGFPMSNKPLQSIFSFDWAGLDPQNGNPMGYVNGEKSSDYAKIINGTSPDKLIYNGPARPTSFGALRNTFSWKNISLSANIAYRLGYYFRRESVDYGYGGILTGNGGHGDYALRWQKPGDEKVSSIPSAPDSPDYYRNEFYKYSSALVEKGDHVRLQDLSLSYELSKANLRKLPFSKAAVYMYADNIGMIWQASKTHLDPDFPTSNMKPVRTIAMGLKLDF